MIKWEPFGANVRPVIGYLCKFGSVDRRNGQRLRTISSCCNKLEMSYKQIEVSLETPMSTSEGWKQAHLQNELVLSGGAIGIEYLCLVDSNEFIVKWKAWLYDPERKLVLFQSVRKDITGVVVNKVLFWWLAEMCSEMRVGMFSEGFSVLILQLDGFGRY